MKLNFYLLFAVFLLIFSCHKNNDQNEYFRQIALKMRPIKGNDYKISLIKQQEFEKYVKTKDVKYLLSSKYTELYSSNNVKSKRISQLYELLKLNNGKYAILSSSCNFELALNFEHTSPKLAMDFIDKAIVFESKLNKKFFLFHEFHAKGRFYFNESNYTKAMLFFEKSLKNTPPDEMLYIASMHNNFGLTYEKLNRLGSAIKEAKRGIDILNGKIYRTKEETDFLYLMKGNLGSYLLKKKDYAGAEHFLTEHIYYNKNESMISGKVISSLEKLFELYKQSHQTEKEKELISYIVRIEPSIKKTQDKLRLNEIVQKYYMDMDDIDNLKMISEKLLQINHKYDYENVRSINETSYILHDFIIKGIDQKYANNISIQKKFNILLIIIAVLIIAIFIGVIGNIRNENIKSKLFHESNALVLEQNIKLREDKIKYLHQNLQLKAEAEKKILENLRKIKKSDVDSDKILVDLLIKVSSMMQIGKRNDLMTNESSIENKLFINKLSKSYPTLTNKELKLCTYFRINLSSKEIATLEDTTTGTVRVYKTKIRTKIDLPKEQDLGDFLSSI
ncbi:hypothetical protein [Chryseobacterium sp. OSA05B]|uniref:tetratricopeptide repeat protein n=1 Tax=Chryseobacterium sp. OSA05B TaxID=2862650 RepID=UPI001CBDEA6D|nr:hypothetical protein [Chryseobacterium sp. OSA05B]